MRARRGIHPDDAHVVVELDDGVEGAVDEPGQLRLARADRPLRAQPPQLGRGAPREDLEDRDALPPRGHHAADP